MRVALHRVTDQARPRLYVWSTYLRQRPCPSERVLKQSKRISESELLIRASSYCPDLTFFSVRFGV